jgi:hypothetical protein
MFGKDKNHLRMKAMDKMMREKPSLSMEQEAPQEEMGEEGFISMPVTAEEKAMILAMRKEKDGGLEEAVEEEIV